MADDTGKKDGIYHAMGRLPGAVSRQDRNAQKHEREAVVNGAESADKTKRVAVAHKKREGVTRCW
jgi:hypothetical protein